MAGAGISHLSRILTRRNDRDHIMHYHFADSATAERTEVVEAGSHIEQALAHSHYARELIESNQLERAKQQSLLALNYFKSSLKSNNIAHRLLLR